MVLAEPEKFGIYASLDLRVWNYVGAARQSGAMACVMHRISQQKSGEQSVEEA